MRSISTEPQSTKASRRISGNLLKKLAIGAVALVAAFLIGYVPSAISSRAARQQNAELEHKLKAAELGSQLAMAGYEAGRNNYANATEFSSRFFSGLGEIINDNNDQSLKQKLQAMLARRDEITSDLAKADQAVREKLAQMYAEYFQAMQAGRVSSK